MLWQDHNRGPAMSQRKFDACLQEVDNRGTPPEAFLNALVDWAREAPDEIFTPNPRHDIYSNIVGELGPWQGTLHRKAAMLEALRVLAGFESSWDWNADVDTTNPDSNTTCTAEAGIFQCSGDSMAFDGSLRNLLVKACGKSDCGAFRSETKKIWVPASDCPPKSVRMSAANSCATFRAPASSTVAR